MARPFAPHIITDDSVLGGKEIERSLRIDNGDGAHLTRTPSSAGNQKKCTFTKYCFLFKSTSEKNWKVLSITPRYDSSLEVDFSDFDFNHQEWSFSIVKESH